MRTKGFDVAKITYIGLFTAITIVLQYLGGFIKLGGMFSVSLVLVPIVIGAALCGKWAGTWLGFVFSVMVFVTGDAAFFLSLNIPGTIITVLVKGTLAGFLTGVVYELLEKFNRFLAVVVSAIVCPVVNTGIFLLGCLIFFLPHDTEIAAIAQSLDSGMALFIGFAMANFIFEIVMNIVLSPVIVKLLNARKK